MACACKNKKQNVEAPKQEEVKNEIEVDLSSKAKEVVDTTEAPNGEKVTISKVE